MNIDLQNASTKRARIGLSTVLVGGVTLLILIAVGSVLWVTLTGATRNTFELLGERANATLDILESRIDGQLLSVMTGSEEFAKQFADGRLNIADDRNDVFHAFSGFLSAHPQVTALIYLQTDQDSIIVTRAEGYPIEVPSTPGSTERRSFALTRAKESGQPLWANPIWVPDVGQPVLTFIAPVQRGVLAHPRMQHADFHKTATMTENPLPRIEDIPEPAFKLLAGGGDEATTLLEYAASISNARVDDETIVITRETDRFGPAVWTLGVVLERAIVGQEVNRLVNMAIVGIVILILAVLLGFLFARHLNRQIGRLVTAAGALTQLDIASARTVPDSRIRELSDAAQAFNRMIAALRLFEVYVPKQLVLRLMRRGEATEETEERVVTIMFTDIRGFSTISEHMDAAGIAGFLNTHFNMLADPIEAEGGTVDKYIGDAVMAFWGAPEEMEDHAARAIRAASKIQRLVLADNERRRRTGEPLLAVRIGVHTGPVVVGNIGSRNRINYTIVGDAVNIASRIDSIAKEIGTNDDCIVLISGDARAHAGTLRDTSMLFRSLGEKKIRGREGTVGLFRLDAQLRDA